MLKFEQNCAILPVARELKQERYVRLLCLIYDLIFPSYIERVCPLWMVRCLDILSQKTFGEI